jgi:hypothetical protein
MSASAPTTVLRATVAASSPAASSTSPRRSRSTSAGDRSRRAGRRSITVASPTASGTAAGVGSAGALPEGASSLLVAMGPWL